MDCPRCNRPLEGSRYKDIVVQTCPECEGSWFEAGDLNQVIRHMVSEEADIPHDKPTVFREIVPTEGLVEPVLDCPRCRVEMDKLNYAYDSNIILDKCPECGGMWADGGEVFRLAVFTKGNPRMDRMANAHADRIIGGLEAREMFEGIGSLGRAPSYALFLPKIILPLGDVLERRTVPAVTLGIIIVNALVFVTYATEPSLRQAVFGIGALVPQHIWAGELLGTMVTHMFLHAGLLHLLGNMLFLYIFGDNVEEAFGHVRYFFVYLGCGLAAAIIHVVASPESTLPCAGASGAISGIMGAYFILYPNASVRTFVVYTVLSIPAAIYIGGWFALQMVWAVVSASTGAGAGVAWFAHVGGFLAGALLAFLWKKRQEGRAQEDES